MIRKITLNGRVIEYEFQRKNVKKINLSIKPIKGVRVSVPQRTTVEYVENFMRNNSDFIINALDKYEKYAESLPKPKQYITGEYFYYLGEKKKLIVTLGGKNNVVANGENICLTVTDTEDFKLKDKVMDKWLHDECAKIVTATCKKLYPKFQKYGIAYPEIKYRKMVSRWGSCRPQRGTLTFNTRLVQTSPKCIELVISHEFTHFLHANHSKDFYNQLTVFMPDWRIYDKQLKELQNEIIIV